MTFKFDENAFKNLEKNVLSHQRKELQSFFDKFARQHQGKPVASIKSTLLREWRRRGGSMTDREAADYATLIHEGTRIVIK